MKKPLAMCVVMATALDARAGGPIADDVQDLSLADLLDTQVDVASKKAQT